MLSVRGVLFNSVLDIPEIAFTIGKEDKRHIIQAIVNILSKSWSSQDLKVILGEMSSEIIGCNDEQTKDYCKSLL